MARKRNVKVRSVPQRSGSSTSIRVGHWAFLLGALLAIIGGFFGGVLQSDALMTTLFVLGIVVGLLNITVKETTPFLVAVVGLMLGAGVINPSGIPVVGLYIRAIFANIVVFVVPAAVIVSLRAIWVLAKEK